MKLELVTLYLINICACAWGSMVRMFEFTSNLDTRMSDNGKFRQLFLFTFAHNNEYIFLCFCVSLLMTSFTVKKKSSMRLTSKFHCHFRKEYETTFYHT